MKIGLIDIDNWDRIKQGESDKVFPNLPLMKLSAWHKKNKDDVSWYDGSYYDKVYVSKVFNFNPDFKEPIHANVVEYGGSGFAIKTINGVEIYDKTVDKALPYDVEHIYPDYDLYGITDTAYGFLQRGCPRKCSFCHVKDMILQGDKPHKVADLSEFWNGQKNIVLLDPNITACKDWKIIFQQLIDSGAYVDFSQGLDVRTMNDEKLDMLGKIKIRHVHMAYDRIEDRNWIEPLFIKLKKYTGWDKHKLMVYVLVNFNTTLEEDVHRVEFLRSLNFHPYIMRYNKESLKRGHILNSLARYCNAPPIFWKYETFDEYLIENVKAYPNGWRDSML